MKLKTFSPATTRSLGRRDAGIQPFIAVNRKGAFRINKSAAEILKLSNGACVVLNQQECEDDDPDAESIRKNWFIEVVPDSGFTVTPSKGNVFIFCNRQTAASIYECVPNFKPDSGQLLLAGQPTRFKDEQTGAERVVYGLLLTRMV